MSSQLEQHNLAIDRLIQTANRIHAEGEYDTNLVSAAMMATCAIHGTILHYQLNHATDAEGLNMLERLKQRLAQQHTGMARCTDRFMAAGTALKQDPGMAFNQVAPAMVAASGVYATFAYAGNQGFLRPGGVDKVTEKYGELLELVAGEELDETYRKAMVDTYQRNLARVQEMKKHQLREEGLLDDNEDDSAAGDPGTGTA